MKRRLEMPKTCLCRSLGRSLCPVHPSVKAVPAAPPVPAKAAPKPAPPTKPSPKVEAPKPAPKPAPKVEVFRKPEPKKAEPKAAPPKEVKVVNGDGEEECYTYSELMDKTKRQLLKIAAENKIDLPRKASKVEMVSLLLGE